MRLFVAIDLPQDVKKYLRSLQDSLPEEGLSKNKDFHLTLMFLGDCNEEQKAQIEGALGKIKFKPFDFSLTKIGHFGGRYYTRVLWVGIDAQSELKRLQEKIEDRLSSFGFDADRRPYHPHISLARGSTPGSSDAINKHGIGEVERMEVIVNSYQLFESHLDSDGARHEILKNFESE
jgi:RNA 2',3'-cyclic 3'-phosphodiesterase